MSKTLKLEISVADLGQNGAVVSEFATTDYVANELSKKANLNAEGKVDPSLLPDYTYVDGLVDKLDDVEQSFLNSDTEILNAAKLYSDNKISENNSKKADLVEGKVPFEQLPFSMNFEQNVSTEFENVRQELRQNSESIVAQMDGLVGSANSYTDGKVLEEREFLNNTINEYKGEVNSQLNNFGNEIGAVKNTQDDIIKNGASLPYDPDLEYVDGALTLKDGEIQQFVGGIWSPFNKTVNASDVKDESGKTQQEINDNQKIKNYDNFSFDDVLSQNEINNSKTTDLSVKLQSVFNDPSIKKIVFKRPYYINQLVTFNHDIEWEFVGDGEFIFGSAGKIEGGGTAELIGKLKATANKYTKSLSVPSGISAGDIICIYNPADFSFSPHRNYYRDGQFAMVADVVNGVATLYDTLYSDYDTTCDVYKVDRKRVTIKNLKFSVNAPTNNIPITISYAKVGIYGLQSTGSDRYGLVLSRCFGGDVISIDVKQFKAVPDGYQYAIAISNCQDLNVIGGNASASRHGVAFGSLGSECAVPNRNVTVSNMTVMATSNGTGGADIHGNADNVKYINCTIQHSSVGGKNISILDSTIYGRELDGLCSWFGELLGGIVEIKRCKLFSRGSGDSGFGFIYAGMNKDLREDLFLDIDDITISAPNSTSLATLVMVTLANNLQLTKKINVSVNNIKGLDLPALRSVLRFQFGSSGSTTKIPVGSVIVDNIKGIPESNLVFMTSEWDAGYDLKLMKQSGSQVINTGNGARTLVSGATTNFKYRYPIVPKLTMSVSTVDGTWNSAFSAVPISAVATLRNNYIAPAIQAPSAMPADKNITVGWEVVV